MLQKLTQMADQHQRHAHSGQVFEGIAALWQAWIHDAKGVRQLLRLYQVMIHDQGVTAQAFQLLHSRAGGDAIIHHDGQSKAILAHILHKVVLDAVRPEIAVWDVIFMFLIAHGIEKVVQDIGSRHSIRIVVTKDHQRLIGIHRPLYPVRQHLDIGKQALIRQIIQAGR